MFLSTTCFFILNSPIMVQWGIVILETCDQVWCLFTTENNLKYWYILVHFIFMGIRTETSCLKKLTLICRIFGWIYNTSLFIFTLNHNGRPWSRVSQSITFYFYSTFHTGWFSSKCFTIDWQAKNLTKTKLNADNEIT